MILVSAGFIKVPQALDFLTLEGAVLMFLWLSNKRETDCIVTDYIFTCSYYDGFVTGTSCFEYFFSFIS